MEPISTDISLVGTNLEADAKRSVGKKHEHTHILRSFKFTFKSTKQCSVSQLLVFTHASPSVTVQRLTASVEFLVPLEPNHSLAVQSIQCTVQWSAE